MVQSDNDKRGTVAAIAQEVEERVRDCEYQFCPLITVIHSGAGNQRLSVGPCTTKALSNETQALLVGYYADTYPDARVLPLTTAETGSNINFINSRAKVASHIILDGRRILPSKSSSKAANSIVQMELNGEMYVGQVIDIFTHCQRRIGKTLKFLRVLWFRRLSILDTGIWDP